MELRNKIAVVTGASRGLGRSISLNLLKNHVQVFGLARNELELNELKLEFPNLFTPVVLDITDSHLVIDWVKNTFSKENAPEILIQNAGIIHHGSIEETSIERWNSVMNLNLNAVFTLTKAFLPIMKESEKSSHIIHISSIAGLIGNPDLSAYNAGKFALKGFSEALMKEVRSFGIKVTCVFPGSIDTKLFAQSGSFTGSPNKLNPDEVANTIEFLLKTSDNFLIDEITIRPLRPKN
jgi:NADP-dependent 3-hydroxy acid dehydrogenase YdfG